jgi:thioredoxin reductase
LDQRLGLETAQEVMDAYDVVVIGAGPAGLTSAIYAVRKNLKTAIIAADIGGQVGTTAEVANYPGFQLVTGPELVQRFAEHADQYGIDKFIGEKVMGIGFRDRCKVVEEVETGAREVLDVDGVFDRALPQQRVRPRPARHQRTGRDPRG